MAKKIKNTKILELANSFVRDVVASPSQIKLIKSLLIKSLRAYDESLRNAITDKVQALPVRVEEDEWVDDHDYVRLNSVLSAIKSTE